MSDIRHTRVVTVNNPQGLHARPAELFVRCAMQFGSKIEVTKGGEMVDAKSMLDVLTLAASQGAQLTIRAQGDDAEAALDALAELVNNGFAVDMNQLRESPHESP
jgi:phosphotransferase system HPr (HPr) family protein